MAAEDLCCWQTQLPRCADRFSTLKSSGSRFQHRIARLMARGRDLPKGHAREA
jgi:hypothetical protein